MPVHELLPGSASISSSHGHSQEKSREGGEAQCSKTGCTVAWASIWVDLQVLLIRRAKPPSLGMYSFPGGSQELGEL